jgi:hypothetical protein
MHVIFSLTVSHQPIAETIDDRSDTVDIAWANVSIVPLFLISIIYHSTHPVVNGSAYPFLFLTLFQKKAVVPPIVLQLSPYQL